MKRSTVTLGIYERGRAYTGKPMTRATPSQYGLSILLAATVITPIISLVTIELASKDFSVPEIIYLKLVAPVRDTTLSLPEPQVDVIQEQTIPDAIGKTAPLAEIPTPALFQTYQEARSQNFLTEETTINLEPPIPHRLEKPISEKLHFRALIVEPRTTNETRMPGTFLTSQKATGTFELTTPPPTRDLIIEPRTTSETRMPGTFRISQKATDMFELTTPPPTRDLRAPASRKKTRVESFTRITSGLKPKPVNTTSMTQIFTPKRTPIAPQTVQRLLIVGTRELNLFNKQPIASRNVPFLERGSVQRPNVKFDVNQSQALISLTSTPTALFLYKIKLLPTINEPCKQVQNTPGTTSNPLKVPLTMEIPFKEPAPDPLISVMQKIKQLEEKYAKNTALGKDDIHHNPSGVNQTTPETVATVQARAGQLDPKYSRLINSQIKANWTPPPGQLDAYHEPVLLRILVDKTGEIQSVQYLRDNNNNDKRYRALIESAYRAVRKTRILHGLPSNEYDKWRELRLNFRLDG